MKLIDLTKDQLIEKLKETRRKHRTIMKHLEWIHRFNAARIRKLEDEVGVMPNVSGLLQEIRDAQWALQKYAWYGNSLSFGGTLADAIGVLGRQGCGEVKTARAYETLAPKI